MQQDLVSRVVTKELQAQVLQLIRQIHEKLPNLIALPVGERRSRPMLGAKSQKYTRVCLATLAQNPELIPRGIDIEAALADLEAMDNLMVVLQALQQLTELVEDTVAALGSDAMFVANLGYGLIKSVGKSSGLDEIVKELSYRHARPRRKKPTPESEGEEGKDGNE